MRLIMIIVYLLLITLGVSFSVLNAGLVDINLYFKSFSLPMSVLLMIVFSVGLLWGVFFFSFRYFRLKFAYSRLKEQLMLTEKEVKNLRSIPLQDQH
ncbi:MAG: LapA family protein [Gammaproteobacteria bacterium]|nr:LapA family protein [Gammaproteobacteria bacterium]